MRCAEHAYERFYPVYQSAWNASRTGAAAYVDYDAPVNVLTGAAGCPEVWRRVCAGGCARRVSRSLCGESPTRAAGAFSLMPAFSSSSSSRIQQNMDIWQNTTLPFSALRVQDYGYSRLTAVNASHARLQYVDNQAGALLDEVWLVRARHGPFGQ
jgi:hypothetical protein